jgi:hypothetical protein
MTAMLADRMLSFLEEVYREGEASAVLDAIAVAGQNGIPLPPWAVEAFLQIRTRMDDSDYPVSLHTLFGLDTAYPLTPKRWRAARRNRGKKTALYQRVLELSADGSNKTVAVLAAAREQGIGKSLAWRWYREIADHMDALRTALTGHKVHSSREVRGIASPAARSQAISKRLNQFE